MSEDDKKPLLTWFNKFEKVLKKLGTNYQKSSIDPTDALEYYYDKKSPEEAAEALAEGVQLDEYIKKDGDRRRCAGGDGRRTGNPVSSTELEERDEPEVVFDFKSERDAKQFAKDVENSMVGLANSGVERYKGKYRVVITDMTKDMDKKAVAKYAKKNKGELSESRHATADRQLKDPKKEVMVVDKKGKVIVIDRKDLKSYERKGWELAESMEEAKSVELSEESDWVLSFEFHSPEYTSKEARAIQNDLDKKFKTYSGNGSFGDGWDCSFNGPKHELEKAKKYVEKKYKNHIEDTAFEINESVELDESKMKELHMHIQDGKTAEQIAKVMNLDVNTIKALMKDHKESVDDTTPRPSFTEDDQKLLDFINKNW